MFPLQTIFEINASSRDPSSQVMRAKRQKDRKAIASFQQGRQGRQEDTAGPAPSCPASQEEKPEEEEEEAAGESVEVLLPPLTAPCPRPSFYPQAQSLRSTRTFLSYLICTEGSVAKKYRLKLPGLVHSKTFDIDMSTCGLIFISAYFPEHFVGSHTCAGNPSDHCCPFSQSRTAAQ